MDGATIEALAAQFVEVVVAPSYTSDAVAAIARKQNVRVLEVPRPPAAEVEELDLKRIGGGFLVQTTDTRNVAREDLRVVTRVEPTEAQIDDLLFA